MIEGMSEADVRNMDVTELKDLVTELNMKISNIEEAKKDYVKAMGDMLKANKKQLALCIDVLSGKDAELARRMLVQVTSLLPK
jgi:Na+/phosphate symporter